MIVTSYTFRIYPTPKQEQKLSESIDVCRDLYNKFIFESRLAYKEGYKLKFDELQRIIPELLQKDKPIYSKVAQMVLWQFYNNLSILSSQTKKKMAGKLRYKSKNQYCTINYNQSGFHLDGQLLRLSKIGKIRINVHRKVIGRIKQIMVKHETTKEWHAYVVAESGSVLSCSLLRKKIVGIDVGITNFTYDSDGHVIKNQKIFTKSEKKIKRVQHRLSKKNIGSSNWFKQKTHLAKIHKKIKNRRNDFLHKISRYYVNNYDTIFVEDLQIKNMQKNHHLAKSILNSAWYSFIQKLEYKAERAGILFKKVNASGTSQICSRCGKIIQKTLAVRTHNCLFCGLVMNRDHNAALNIKMRGMASLPMGYGNVTPAEIVPLLAHHDNKQGQSRKQEIHCLGIG